MVAEHLLLFPDRDVAEDIADELRRAGFDEVRVVREALSGEDDSEAHEWAVWVSTPDEPAYAARFRRLAADHDGWYDPHPHD